MATIASDIKDAGRAAEGQDRMDWAAREMPVLRSIQERFSKEKPLEGMRIAACLHVTTETSNLILTLKEGGSTGRPMRQQPSQHTGRRRRVSGRQSWHTRLCRPR